MSIIKKDIPFEGYFLILLIFNRYCRLLSLNGYSDITVKIKNEYIKTIKFFLINSNDIFKCLIDDKLFNGCLELYDDCTVDSFYMLERFYSGGTIILNPNNCIETLKICIYYNELELLKECEKYILNTINEYTIKYILKNEIILKCESLKELKDVVINYIKKNGYKLLEEKMMMDLPLYVLELVINYTKIYEGEEIDFLRNLLKYYNKNKDKDTKVVINKLLMKINYNVISLSDLNENEINELEKFSNMKGIIEYKRNMNNKINIIECSEEIKEIILKYYNNIENTLCINQMYLKNININEVINLYKIVLKENKDFKLLLVILLIMHELNIEIIIPNYKKTIIKLLSKYDETNNENLKKLIIKLFTLLIKDSILIYYISW